MNDILQNNQDIEVLRDQILRLEETGYLPKMDKAWPFTGTRMAMSSSGSRPDLWRKRTPSSWFQARTLSH